MRVLITGSAGFVGRHFDAVLTAAGHEIWRIDIADPIAPSDVRGFFRWNNDRFDLVIHCAAVVGGRTQIEGDPLSLAVDLSIDAEMFNWAVRTEPGRIVYFSSSAAYPTELQEYPLHRRLREVDIELDNIMNPDMTYGWAKLTGEMLAQYVPNVTIVRPFSGYGEDQALDYPFPSFIDRAHRKADPFEVWGDGTQTRDWIHIDDIVGATLAAVERRLPGPVNLGSGVGTSFRELAELVIEAAGYDPDAIKYLPEKPAGVHYRVSDNSKMLQFYTPEVSLEEGIRRALLAREQIT